MSKHKISRAEFVEAIEVGIERTDLTRPEIATLRTIGATAPNTARGLFAAEGYTCPLCTAGISDGTGTNKNLYGFFAAFDDATGRALRKRYGLSRVSHITQVDIED